MPKDNSERIIDWPYSPTKSRSGTVSGGGGGGGGGATNLDGLTDVTLSAPSNAQVLSYNAGTGQWVNGNAGLYTAGEAIAISGLNVISVLRNGAGAVGVTGGGLSVNVGDGIQIVSNALALKLKTTSGLELDSSGLALADAIAGNGLIIAGKVLAVGAGDGIDSNANDIAVDVTDFIDTTQGLKEDASNNIQVRLETNSALQFGGAGGIQLGTPSTLAYNSTNSVTAATHSHAITSSSDVGTTPAQAILASTGAGALTLAQLTLRGNLIFAGGDRGISASNTLYIIPTTDLILDPGGLVMVRNAQDVRTETINDLPTGIDGFRIWNRYANYTQLTIGAIKADELYVRVFVADETRIDRGEEYWSKSFGIVQADFTMPAIGATADVWFEDAPAAVSFFLFAVGDYLLMRTIDWGTGLVVQKVWWQVIAGLAQETTAVNGVDRQQWRIQRIAGGINGSLIKRGNMMLDTGVVGQGWVHLSALSQDGGPFIQIGTMTSVATVPQFTNYVRMGNLNGTVDYAANVFGFAAGGGAGGLGLAPSAGFSGLTAEATNGLRLFNTSILLYSGGILGTTITNTNGIRLLQDSVLFANPNRYIEWFSTLGPPIADANRRGTIRSFQDTGRSGMQIYSLGGSAAEAYLELGAQGNGKSNSIEISTQSNLITMRANQARLDQTLNNPVTIYVANPSTGTSAIAAFTADENGAVFTLAKSSQNLTTFKIIAAGDGYLYNSVRGDIAVLNDYASGGIKLAAGGRSAADVTINATGGVVISPINATNSVALQLYDPYNLASGARLHWQQLASGSTSGDGFSIAFVHPTVYLYNHEAGALNFGTSNTQRMVIDPNGRVGIGTGTPVGTESFSRLTVEGSDATAVIGAIINTGAGQAGLVLNRTGTSASRWVLYLPPSADKLYFYSGTLAASVLTLTKDGYAGLGTTTPEVVTSGFSMTPAAGYAALTVAGNHARMMVKATGSAGFALVNDSNSFNMRWFQMSSYSNITEMTVANDIGTLAVQRFIVLDHSTGQVRVGVDSTALVGGASQLQVGAQDKHIIRATLYGSAAQFTLVGARAFGTAAAPSGLTSGNVVMAIGAQGYTNGGWQTVVNGEIDFRATEDYNGGVTSKGGAEILIYTRTNGASTVYEAVRLYHNGIMQVPGVDGYNMGATGKPVYVKSDGMLGVQTSSLRFKRDIRPLPQHLDDAFVMALEPVIYKSNPPKVDGIPMPEDPSDYIGFIAEKIEEAGGQLFVGYDKLGQPESLRYDLLTVPIVAALQGLIPYKARIAELEARISELERRLH